MPKYPLTDNHPSHSSPPPSPSVQVSNVTYELHSLGWKAFQDLCLTILNEIMGQTVELFLPTKDGGRDGAFSGNWKSKGQLIWSGSFTVQCKFTSRRGTTLTIRGLSDELKKAKRLAKKGLSSNYLLMTNHALTGVAQENIRKAFLKIPGIQNFATFGAEWISQTIRESPRLRMLVPRVYGLGDLTQILDQRVYDQTRDILESMRFDLAKFVLTDAYRKSAKALMSSNFVVLLGEPASGKSTIASALAIGANDTFGCFPMKVTDAQDFRVHRNPNESKQFFWVDDVFGATQYQRESVQAWNRTFSLLSAAIRGGARVLFTSRDYIFSAALRDLKIDAFPLLRESQVIINVQNLSRPEKEQILYNHIKLGDQRRGFRRKIKPYLPEVAGLPHFTPEIARRLGTAFFTKHLDISREGLNAFVEEPAEFLGEILRTLSDENRAALALIFMNGGTLSSPMELTKEERRALELLGASISAVRIALNDMNNSLVKLEQTGGKTSWYFKHPTIRDAFAYLVAVDPELLDIYLRGTPAEKLVYEITCGDVGLAGVKLMVPATRYRAIVEKLKDVHSYYLCTFLSSRCDSDFVKLYIQLEADLLNTVTSPTSYHPYSPQVELLGRLHELGLVPETQRRAFAAELGRLAVERPQDNFLENETLKALVSPEEKKAIRDKVRDELLPNVDAIIEDFESDGDDSQIEEDLMAFRSTLEYYELDCGAEDDLDFQEELLAAIEEVNRRIDQVRQRLPSDEDDRSDDDMVGRPTESASGQTRSIFDDVDQ